MITSEFVPVRHCRAIVARFTEELQEVLGAVCGNAATLKHQDCGCVLLHEQQGVACRPGEFRRPVPSLDLRFGLPWLFSLSPSLRPPPLGVSAPGPQSSVRPPRGPSHTTHPFPLPDRCAVARFNQVTHIHQFNPFSHETTRLKTSRPLCVFSAVVLFRMLPRRASSCGGTSHSDPITTTAQVLRPSTLQRSPTARRTTTT